MLGQILGTVIGDKAGRMIGANMDAAKVAASGGTTAPTISQVLAGNQQSGQSLQMPQMQQTQNETPKLSRPFDNIVKLLPTILAA